MSRLSDKSIWTGIGTLGVLVPLAVVGLMTYLVVSGLSMVSLDGLSELFSLVWLPSEGHYGMVPLLIGTFVSAFSALPLVLLMGLPASVYLAFFSARQARVLMLTIFSTLAGMPSVVVGIFVLGWCGVSLFSAVITILVLVLPQFILNVAATLRQIPQPMVLTLYASGLTEGRVIYLACREVWATLAGSIFVALARGFGEAVALTFVAGNVALLWPQLFGPIRTLTTTLVLELDFASGEHFGVLHLLAFAVMCLIAMVIWFGRYLSKKGSTK